MKAVFLEDVEIKDGRKKMLVNKGNEMTATDRGEYYELRRADGVGTMAPKSAEGKIYKIVED